MKYFTKYLPVEGEIKEGDFLQINSSGHVYPCTKDRAKWYMRKNYSEFHSKKERKVKLFLCSRDNGEPIGLVSEKAVWIKEGNEFSEEDIHRCFAPKVWPTGTIQFRCPTCKQFH